METETFTPSPTPASSETATPPAPTATTTPIPGVSLVLRASPPLVGKDGYVNLQWRVEGLSRDDLFAAGPAGRSAARFSLRVRMPSGFVFAPPSEVTADKRMGEEAQLDPASGTLVIPLTGTSGRMTWMAADTASGPYPILAELLDGGKGDRITASASLTVQEGRYDPVPARGGRVEWQAGGVQVTFPERSLSGAVRVRIKPLGAEARPARSLGGHAFEVLALDESYFTSGSGSSFTESGGGPTATPAPGRPSRPDYIHKFRGRFTIQVAYNPAAIDGDESSLILFYYDDSLKAWLPLPTVVDTLAKTLRATTDHLTVFDYKAQNFEAARLPSMQAFQTSTFTGAASYSLPLWVPPGPGGLQPGLILAYNSQAVEGATSQTQASWVGMGWSLDAGGSIVRDTHGTIDYTGDDSFSLTTGGVGGLLLPGADGYLHTADESHWRILYNDNNDTWTAWDTAGSVYSFSPRARSPMYTGCTAPSMQTWQWSLASIRNIAGRELTFTYTVESKTVADTCGTNPATLDLAVYPNTVVYPNNRYRVRFVTAADRQDYLYDWTLLWSRTPFQMGRLAEVRVEQDANGDGTFETLMRKYAFTYESDPARRVLPGVSWPYSCSTSGCQVYPGELTLTRVQEYGTDGTSTLPATTFSYDGARLVRGENGYGGRVEFQYDSTPWQDVSGSAPVEQRCQEVDLELDNHTNFDYWTNGQCSNNSASGRFSIFGGQTRSVNYDLMRSFQPGSAYRIQATAYGCTGCNASLAIGYNDGLQTIYPATQTLPDDGTPVQFDFTFVLGANASQLILYLQGSNWSLGEYKITPLLTRYRVTAQRLYDGISPDPDVYSYQYVGAASNDPAHSDLAGEPYATRYKRPYSEFRGHASVTETGPNGRRSVTVFYQSDGLKGRVQDSWVEDPSGKKYSESLNAYGMDNLSIQNDSSFFPRKKDGTLFTDLRLTWVYATSMESRTYSNDGSYAATKTESQYLAEDQGGTQYGNLTRTIESAWQGGTWVPYRATRKRYFPNVDAYRYLVSFLGITEKYSCASGCTFDPGTRLAATWLLYDGATAYDTPPAAGFQTAQRVWISAANGTYSNSTFGYDDWNNQTSVTRYSGFGTEGALAATGPQATVTEYDAVYHTYPVKATNPLGRSVTTAYD